MSPPEISDGALCLLLSASRCAASHYFIFLYRADDSSHTSRLVATANKSVAPHSSNFLTVLLLIMLILGVV